MHKGCGYFKGYFGLSLVTDRLIASGGYVGGAPSSSVETLTVAVSWRRLDMSASRVHILLLQIRKKERSERSAHSKLNRTPTLPNFGNAQNNYLFFP